MKRLLGFFAVLAAVPAHAQAPAAQVTVISMYEGMAAYVEAAAADPNADLQALWTEKVIDPYWKDCTEGARYLDYAPPLRDAITDLAALRAGVAALRAASVDAAVRTAAEKAAAMVSGPPTTVCIATVDPSWTYLQMMHGVGGFTPGPGKVWLTILPEGDWQEWIAYGVAHEYHHSAWMAGSREVEDLADYLVFEGRADSFARLVAPGLEAPWTSALTPQEEREAWRALEGQLGSTDAEVPRSMTFGGVDGMPRWAGYRIGFRVVQAYLAAHPDVSVSEWTALPATELIRQAGYAPGERP